LKRAFAALPKWPWKRNRATAEAGSNDGSDHLELARESLRELIDDARLPDGVRESLAHDYDAVKAMLDKLEHGHLHLAAFGRVSTGKSSLLNALIGKEAFSVSPLHGETRTSSMQAWNEIEAGGVYLIDTPGLDEAGGEDREGMAREVAGRSDLVIFVLDSDITDTELRSLRTLLAQGRPVIVVLNKSDLFTGVEKDALLRSIRDKTDGIVDPAHIISVAAQPRPQIVVEVGDNGVETEHERPRTPDVEALRLRLWDILDAEGKTLAALNASCLLLTCQTRSGGAFSRRGETLAKNWFAPIALARGSRSRSTRSPLRISLQQLS
jgi:small GTP-binding protein